MRKLMLTALALLATLGALEMATPSAQAAKPSPLSCSNVRCMSCPPGYHLLFEWPNCCDCIPD